MRAALFTFISFLLIVTQSLAQETTLQTNYIVGTTLTTPVGVVADESGNLYVANSYQVRVLDPDGNFVKDILPAEVPSPGHARAIAKDKKGNIYVWDSYSRYLYKFDKEGRVLFKFRNYHTDTFIGSYVEGIAVAPDGSIYITDVYKHVVRKFSSEGQFLLELSGFRTPTDVTVGPDGSIYVADTDNRRIVKYSSTAQFDTAYTTPGNAAQGFGRPTSVEAGSNGELYVADAGSTTVYSFNENSGNSRSVKLQGIGSGVNMGIGLDASGNMYVSVSGSLTYQPIDGKLIKLSPSGDILDEFGSPKAASVKISLTALEMDSVGHYLYAGDRIMRKVHVFSRQGYKLREFGKKGTNSEFNSIEDIAAGPDGSIYVLDNLESGTPERYSATGQFLSEFEAAPGPEANSSHHYKLTAGLDNFFYVLGEGQIVKYDKLGRFLSVITLSDSHTFSSTARYKDIAVDGAGNFYVIIIDNDYNTSFFPLYKINKYSGEGDLLLQFHFDDRNTPKSIDVDKQGYVYVAGGPVRIYDTEGNPKGYAPAAGDEIAVSAAGNTMLAGSSQKDHILILGKLTFSQSSYLSGTIYHDVDSDKKLSQGDLKMKDVLVKAEPGSIFGKSDAYGNYKIAVEDTGTYKISQVLSEKTGLRINQTSPEGNKPHIVSIAEKKSTVSGINFANQVTLSPYLSVSVSSTRRRRCFESTTKLTYSNTGFAHAQNAKAYLQLPEQVELLSANKPFTRLPDGTYVFEAGTVAPGETSVITIQDKVVCGDESIRGLTVCTRAWITPGNQPPTAPPTAVSAVSGKCDAATGYVRFVIRNTGQADMATGEQFRIYQDGKLATMENYTLAAGDSMVFRVPAMGRTIRLEADQPDGNGDNTLASATVEACRAGGSPVAFSTGFVNAMPADDEEAEVAAECLPIIDSFDPNDKAVFPTGVTAENFTPTHTALQYKIRFQNTGTDVAYQVVVVDTLSEHLDISTLQLGSASHSYTYAVSGKGRPVLTWTLHNIMLPDSTTNEPGSHGYIQFSIKPKADLPEKTAVENFADIFFDYNSPVRTNVTVNRIYDMPREVLAENKILSEAIIMTPAIQAFSPAAGKLGAEVLITGTKFSEDARRNKVYINGVQAEVLEGTATSLRVRVPEGAHTGILSVVTEDAGASSTAPFTVYQPPVVSGFSPAEGVVGAEVTLHGSYLADDELESVKLGELACDVISATPEALVLRVPEGAASGNFHVHTKGGIAESAAPYIVWHQPHISGLSKRTDKVGSELIIYGDNFSTVASRNTVKIGQVQAGVLQASATSLKVQVPQGAASGYITVETPGGAAVSASAFEVIPAPVLLSVSPAIGSVGTVVELEGAHFLVLGQQDTVLFNGAKAIVLRAGGTSLTVRVPRGAQTGKIQVSGIGGSTHSASDFVVEELTPQQAIAVYANPSSGKFTIDYMKADFEVHLVEIFNTIGTRVFHQAAGEEGKLEADLTALPAGLYHVQVSTSRGKVLKRLSVL